MLGVCTHTLNTLSHPFPMPPNTLSLTKIHIFSTTNLPSSTHLVHTYGGRCAVHKYGDFPLLFHIYVHRYFMCFCGNEKTECTMWWWWDDGVYANCTELYHPFANKFAYDSPPLFAPHSLLSVSVTTNTNNAVCAHAITLRQPNWNKYGKQNDSDSGIECDDLFVVFLACFMFHVHHSNSLQERIVKNSKALPYTDFISEAEKKKQLMFVALKNAKAAFDCSQQIKLFSNWRNDISCYKFWKTLLSGSSANSLQRYSHKCTDSSN